MCGMCRSSAYLQGGGYWLACQRYWHRVKASKRGMARQGASNSEAGQYAGSAQANRQYRACKQAHDKSCAA